ncbi:uroporphyrinogen-III synthase [Xanthobacter pseudotagetidis]|uniref:uroporphyrinogen-III synthase n=1 Tax=Xanthobacter pseudotagetidis TaxID=3119911 RepID=UPI00372856D9
MLVLVTRPEPAAQQTAARLAAMGHEALVDPMLRIAPTGAALPDGPFEAVAFTSVNGVKALAAHADFARFRGLPAFAVGPRTAREARQAGFPEVTDCDGDAAALAGRLAAALGTGARVLHPAGEDRAADLGALLEGHGLRVALAIVYAAVPADALGPATRAALAAGTIGAALHFSPRTVKTLLACAGDAGLDAALREVRHLCLSAQVAAALGACRSVAVAAAPNEDALLALL